MITNRRVIMTAGAFFAAWLFAESLSFGLLQTVNVQQGGPIPAGAPFVTLGTTDFYFNVAGAGSVLDYLQVRLAIQDYSTDGLGISLYSPNNKQVVFFNHEGSLGSENLQDTLFDDSASQSITSGTAPFAGTYRPEPPSATNALRKFYGDNPNGIWDLRISNTRYGDYGYLYRAGDPQANPNYFALQWPNLIGTQLIITSNTPGSVTAVPEPLSAGLSLAGLGVLGLRLLGRRRVG